jgi:hypothetical protein
MPSPVYAAFLDELEKISAAHGRMHVPKTREGRRPMSVHTLLKKDKDGTLYKKADAAGRAEPVASAGTDDPGAARIPKRPGEVPSKETNYPDQSKIGEVVRGETHPMTLGESPFAYQEAIKPKKKGDVPSQENINVVDSYDQRNNATTITGLAQQSTGIGAFNSPSEHT